MTQTKKFAILLVRSSSNWIPTSDLVVIFAFARCALEKRLRIEMSKIHDLLVAKYLILMPTLKMSRMIANMKNIDGVF